MLGPSSAHDVCPFLRHLEKSILAISKGKRGGSSLVPAFPKRYLAFSQHLQLMNPATTFAQACLTVDVPDPPAPVESSDGRNYRECSPTMQA